MGLGESSGSGKEPEGLATTSKPETKGQGNDDASTSRAAEEREYLASSGYAMYNAGPRVRKDTCWVVAYCLLAALTFFGGIATFANMNPHVGEYTSGFYNNSTSCNITTYQASVDQLMASLEASEANGGGGGQDADYDYAIARAAMKPFGYHLKRQLSVWLPITAALALVGGTVYVLLFRRFAKAMVMITIVFSLLSGYAFAILSLATGSVGFGVILLLISVVMTLVFWWIRDQLQMCATLLSIASRGLSENVALVPTAMLIKAGGLGILLYMFVGFLCAFDVGEVRRNAYAVRRTGDDELEGVCFDANGLAVPCCAFAVAGPAGAYAFFAMVTLVWTIMLVMQIRLYVVADTMAQWYYSPAAAAGGSSSIAGARPVRGSVRRALRNCFTSSFGSVAFSAAILALLRTIRSIMERMARRNVFCFILNCIIQPLLAMAEKFTRFATIAAAITGEGFVPAAHLVFDTLKRNFLQTYSLWWVPDMVLGTAVTLMSLSWGAIVFFSVYAEYREEEIGLQVFLSYLVALVCFGCVWFVLHFVASLLLDIVNTLYICYAMDKDARHVTHPEVHAIYAQVPTLIGSVIENPDGNMMYGAPDAQQQQQRYGAYPPSYPPAPPPYPGAYPPTQVQMAPVYVVPVAPMPGGGAYPAVGPSAGAPTSGFYPPVAPAGYAPVQQAPPHGYGNASNV